MCLELRNTVSRGRSTVPVILRRTCRRRRNCRFRLAFWWSMLKPHRRTWRAGGVSPRMVAIIRGLTPPARRCLAAAGEGLAFLAAYLFALVADALALVRFGLAHRSHL